MKNLITLLLSSLIITSAVLAECVPTDNPCAPKPKVGEWTNSLAFGFNKTSGNSDTTLITLGGTTHFEKDKNLFDGNLLFNFGEDKTNTAPGEDSTTRNDFRAVAQYSRLLNERRYLAMGSSFFHDEIAKIDHRFTLDPAYGYYFLKDNSFLLKLEAGPSYVFEKVASVDNDYFAPRIGNKFEWYLTCTSKLFQNADAYFDVNNSENFILNFQAGAEAALAENLSLVFTVREIFDNQPAEGLDKDDLAIITALKVTM